MSIIWALQPGNVTNSKFWYEVRKKIQEVLEQEKALGIKRDIENEDDDSDDVIPGSGGADSEVCHVIHYAVVMLHIWCYFCRYNDVNCRLHHELRMSWQQMLPGATSITETWNLVWRSRRTEAGISHRWLTLFFDSFFHSFSCVSDQAPLLTR